MTPGAKVFLTVLGAGAVVGTVLLFTAKPASAAEPKQPKPGSNEPPDVVVPELGSEVPPGPAPQPPPLVLPNPIPGLQPLPPPVAPQAPPVAQTAPTMPSITQTLPNPLGGPPLGTFNPATGDVFGPDGTVIGQFNPKTGLFTSTSGMQVTIPGFGGSSSPVPVPLPLPSVPAQPQAPPMVPLPLPPPSVSVPPPPGPVSIQLPQIAPPIAPPAATGTTVQSDTANLVHGMLDAETRSGWNVIDPIVRAWQKSRGLTADGKFGPQTALTVAKELGTLPLIRFWPLGSTKAKLLAAYQDALMTLSAAARPTDPARADELQHSAQRETALAYSTKGALPPVPLSAQVQIAQVA